MTPLPPSPFTIVYVLSNPAMPGLVKIGRTSHSDATERLAQLYSTGVPFPFKLEFACRVTNSDEVEGALHIAFGPHRVNPKREFFAIEAAQAIAILKLLHTEDKTLELQDALPKPDSIDETAAEKFSAKRPPLNFEEMGIPVGSVLSFVKSDATVTITGPKRVILAGEETSLTGATKELLGLAYNVAPGPYWTFNGKLVSAIYDETYSPSS